MGVLPTALCADDVMPGFIHLEFQGSGLLFKLLCTGWLLGLTWRLLGSLMLGFVLVKGTFLRKLSHGIVGLDAQFQCRLFLLVQPLMLGTPAVLLVVL